MKSLQITLDCNGACHSHNDKSGYSFKVACNGHNQGLPNKIIISKSGRANKDYGDICYRSTYIASIAHNNAWGVFYVEDGTTSYLTGVKAGQMVEYGPRWPAAQSLGGIPVVTLPSFYPWHSEILSSFFINYGITPLWINCNSTWGIYDEETGRWTGAVGKVF